MILNKIKSQLPWAMLIILIGEFGEVLWRTEGHYHARRLFYTLSILTLTIFFNFKKKYFNPEKIIDGFFLERIFFFIFSYWGYKTFLEPKVIYIQDINLNNILRFTSLLTCMISAYFTIYPKKFKNNWAYLFIAIILVQRLCTVIGSPTPHIDVFTSNTKAVKAILQGINPYLINYEDIYRGRYDYKPGLVYWPGIFLWQLPSFIIFKDVRIFFIMAEGLILLGLWRILRKYDLPKEIKILTLLLWSLFPVQNFVLEQSWIDPGLMALTLWFLIFILEEKFYLSAFILGIIVATKQYGVITALICVPLLWNKLKFKKMLFYVGLSLVSFTTVILPFYLGAPSEFIDMTLTVPAKQAFRGDSFSFIAVLWNNYPSVNFLSLTWIAPLSFLILTLVSLFFKTTFKATILGLFFCYLGIFLFGKQAFCNYYFFLMPFLFIYFILEIASSDSKIIFEDRPVN